MVSRTSALMDPRVTLAQRALDALPDAELGDIVLRPDQRRIAARAARALREHGGCLIAEDVGRGKTFVALALARGWARRLVVAPASLRATWALAMRRAGVSCEFASHESLSRGRAPAGPFDGVIVDESHHYRNPATQRYDALAALVATCPVVLL